MKPKKTVRRPRKVSKKSDRTSASSSVYAQVLRGLRDFGFTPEAFQTLALAAERSETHDKVLFGVDGRAGLVQDTEAMKMNMQGTLTSINLSLSQFKSSIEDFKEWRSSVVVKVAAIIAAACTVSAILGAVLSFFVNWKWLLSAFFKPGP